MLLSLMRKHAKSWLIKFLIGIIAVVFVFYFGYSFTSEESAKIAEVNGEAISYLEYQNAYRERLMNLQQQYQNMWSDNLIEFFDIKNQALEDLIEKKIISREAEKRGLGITEKEIRDIIMGLPDFQYAGVFNENRYRSLLANIRTDPEAFEVSIAQDLLKEKLTQFLRTFLVVCDQEVLDFYTYFNEKVKISFAWFYKKDFIDSVEVEQSLMENYFEEHKEAFRIPDRIKIDYIVIHPEDFRDQVKLDDHEINSYYEDNQEMFKDEKQIRARHILFRVPSDASADEEEKVKEKALSVLEKARSGQDFSELAKEYSEGGTRDQGGDLGYFSKGQRMESFEEAAFSMEKGQISDLVKTSYGYHIIKVEDIKEGEVKEFEEVRDQISDILISNEAMDLANERALSLLDQMPYDVDLVQYAEQHDVTLISTDYFSQYESIPYIGGDEKLKQSIFSLQNKEASEVIEFDNNFYIIQIADREASYTPDMEEVADQVREDYIAYLAKLEAISAAERYLARLREGSDWDELAKETGIKTETTDFFTRRDYPENIGMMPGLNEAVFNLNENNRYHDTVFEGEDGALVIRWDGEQGIDEEKFQEQKDQYAESLVMFKRQALYNTWLERLKDKADIDRSQFAKYR